MSLDIRLVHLLPSPSAELEALARRRLKAEGLLLFDLGSWLALSGFLLALNLVISGFSPPWSLWPAAAWGMVVALHAYLVLVLGQGRYVAAHRRLSRHQQSERERGGTELEEIEGLRQHLLRSAEEARRALRPISPEAVGDISRGESLALLAVAWLAQAGRLLAGAAAQRELRQRVAAALSQPGDESGRLARERLLGQLDQHDVKLAALEREAGRRRSLLESFLLVIESAGVARSSAELLAAVSGPLHDRVERLAAIFGVAAGGGRDGVASPASESERIRHEVRLAQELQRSILPRQAPPVTGLAVACHYQPSSEVGGDFFDFYALGPRRLLVAVGDASGHGLDSSMVSSMAKSALYTHVSAGRGLSETLSEMNRLMCDTLGRRRLMTLALLELDTEAGRLSWVNAGQVFPLLRRDGKVRELELSSYPLGVRREVEVRRIEEPLLPGDLLLLLTDGFFEAADEAGVVYGWDRLLARLAALGEGDVETLVAALAEDLRRHLGGGSAQDDITLVAIEVRE